MDLISKTALLNDLCEDREEGTFCFTDSQAEAADKIIVYVAKRINAQPTVDAAPVVRCGDCKWYDAELHCKLNGFGCGRKPDWFCADGKKEEE